MPNFLKKKPVPYTTVQEEYAVNDEAIRIIKENSSPEISEQVTAYCTGVIRDVCLRLNIFDGETISKRIAVVLMNPMTHTSDDQKNYTGCLLAVYPRSEEDPEFCTKEGDIFLGMDDERFIFTTTNLLDAPSKVVQ